MKKVFNNINDVAKLFIAQTQEFAGTPVTYIEGRGKSRRFYFKGDTIYSYRDTYPLAKIIDNMLYIKEENYSATTNKHKWCILRNCNDIIVIQSEDLCNPNSNDKTVKKMLYQVFNAKKYFIDKRNILQNTLNNKLQPITESKFPLLFDKKHKKLKQMFFSNDIEVFNLSKKLIKQQKLI